MVELLIHKFIISKEQIKREKMKNRDIKVLCELLKNSKISDRQLARKLNISQSTATRIRNRLEKRNLLSYVGIPNLSSLNINLVAFTFARCTKPTIQAIKKMKSFVTKNPKIIFAGEGEGMGKTGIIISLHRDFSDYVNFIRLARAEYKSFVEGIESFFVSNANCTPHFALGRAVEAHLNKN